MKCYNCGTNLVEHNGNLEIPNAIIGNFSISNATYHKCADCDEILLSSSTWKTVDEEEKRITNSLLLNLPLNKFIGASPVAKILGISRQALHKHRRIRRGFIYSITYEGKIYYHIESVKLYKETGDGRLPLTQATPKKEVEYVYFTIPYSSEGNNFRDYGGREEPISWHPSQNTLPTIDGKYYEQ